MRILIIEDDLKLAKIMKEAFRNSKSVIIGLTGLVYFAGHHRAKKKGGD